MRTAAHDPTRTTGADPTRETAGSHLTGADRRIPDPSRETAGSPAPPPHAPRSPSRWRPRAAGADPSRAGPLHLPGSAGMGLRRWPAPCGAGLRRRRRAYPSAGIPRREAPHHLHEPDAVASAAPAAPRDGRPSQLWGARWWSRAAVGAARLARLRYAPLAQHVRQRVPPPRRLPQPLQRPSPSHLPSSPLQLAAGIRRGPPQPASPPPPPPLAMHRHRTTPPTDAAGGAAARLVGVVLAGSRCRGAESRRRIELFAHSSRARQSAGQSETQGAPCHSCDSCEGDSTSEKAARSAPARSACAIATGLKAREQCRGRTELLAFSVVGWTAFWAKAANKGIPHLNCEKYISELITSVTHTTGNRELWDSW